jgi:predicted RND superfamily exporter protein
MKVSQRVAKLAECFATHPAWTLGIALIISLLAGWATAQLPVLTSRQALLPQNTAVTKRFNDFLQNFGAASDLLVVLEGAPANELETFADDLAAKLRTEPEINQAISHIDLDFFLNHAYLLAPSATLDKLTSLANSQIPNGGLEEILGKGLAWSKDQPLQGADADLKTAQTSLNVASFFLEEWLRWLSAETTPSSLDWNRLLAKTGAASMHNGYFTSRDGRMLFLFVHPKDASEAFEQLGPFIDKVQQTAADLAKQTQAAGHTPPSVGLTGLPAMEYEEFTHIRQDIGLVIGSALGLIAALILLVVRSLRWALLIFLPMGLGVLWSLGLALVTVGHLTIITATFIAILFGLGADYGIFTSSRIAEERRTGKPLIAAIGAGVGASFGAVLTAGIASLLIFGALATVDFPGFAELGVVAAKGVLMILISTWVVQPALYALLPPKLKDLPTAAAGSNTLPYRPSKQHGATPKFAALALVLAAIAFALFGVLKGLNLPFDYDILSLLPKDSQAAYFQRRMAAESDYKPEAIIFVAKDMAEARRITSEAGKLKTISQVQSLTELFPTDAEERLHKALGISAAFTHSHSAQQLSELDRAGLSAKSLQLLQELLENSANIVDTAQEQLFSSGHTDLVAQLETLRGQISTLSAKLGSDGEQGRLRSEQFLRTLLSATQAGLKIINVWAQTNPLTPAQIPPSLHDRFFAANGSIAIYAFPAKTVYDPDNLDALINDVYNISPEATGFPTTYQVFSKLVVESFSQGTKLAFALCLLWILAATRSLRGFILAALPLLLGGGWMLGIMTLSNIHYNYANMVALPMVIALAVDYGVWFNYRWNELQGYSPWQISLIAGKVIGLAAGTELAGLGAITLASYRGVSSMGASITIGLLCCLTATLIVAPAIGLLLDSKRKT